MLATATAAPLSGAADFKASWPDRLNPELQNTCLKVITFILRILLFPFIWLRDWVRGTLFAQMIYPGTGKPDEILGRRLFQDGHIETYTIKDRGEELLRDFAGEPLTVTTPDKLDLDGAIFPGTRHHKAIVYLGGNGEQWETTPDDILEMLKATGATIISVNPRGIGGSQWAVPDQDSYALDVWTAVMYAHENLKIPLNDIVHVGRSQGGAVGSVGMALVQEQFPNAAINAMNITSYGQLSVEAAALLTSPHRVGCTFSALRCIEPLSSLVISGVIRLVGAEIRAAEALKTLKGRTCVVWNRADDVIPYDPAQMHFATQGSLPSIELDSENPAFSQHNRPFSKEEKIKIVQELCSMLNIPSAEILEEFLKALQKSSLDRD